MSLSMKDNPAASVEVPLHGKPDPTELLPKIQMKNLSYLILTQLIIQSSYKTLFLQKFVVRHLL